MGEEIRDKILVLVKQKGPLLPVQLVKEIPGLNTIFAGAILSELYASKKVFISHIKVGGSPLYYVQGQEEKLQNYTQYLHETTINFKCDHRIERHFDMFDRCFSIFNFANIESTNL